MPPERTSRARSACWIGARAAAAYPLRRPARYLRRPLHGRIRSPAPRRRRGLTIKARRDRLRRIPSGGCGPAAPSIEGAVGGASAGIADRRTMPGLLSAASAASAIARSMRASAAGAAVLRHRAPRTAAALREPAAANAPGALEHGGGGHLSGAKPRAEPPGARGCGSTGRRLTRAAAVFPAPRCGEDAHDVGQPGSNGRLVPDPALSPRPPLGLPPPRADAKPGPSTTGIEVVRAHTFRSARSCRSGNEATRVPPAAPRAGRPSPGRRLARSTAR